MGIISQRANRTIETQAVKQMTEITRLHQMSVALSIHRAVCPMRNPQAYRTLIRLATHTAVNRTVAKLMISVVIMFYLPYAA